MSAINAQDESFEVIEVLGQSALFTSLRIKRATVPQGLFQYEVRHDDDGRGDPVEIAKGIMVNHWGTILTRKPLELPENGYLSIDPEKDWSYGGNGEQMTAEEFLTGQLRSNQGYTIIDSVRTGDSTELVLGESKTAPCRFVVWKCKDNADYVLDFYSNDEQKARQRMQERAEDERTGIPKKPKEKPHER